MLTKIIIRIDIFTKKINKIFLSRYSIICYCCIETMLYIQINKYMRGCILQFYFIPKFSVKQYWNDTIVPGMNCLLNAHSIWMQLFKSLQSILKIHFLKLFTNDKKIVKTIFLRQTFAFNRRSHQYVYHFNKIFFFINFDVFWSQLFYFILHRY